jgi:hypothetical protein
MTDELSTEALKTRLKAWFYSYQMNEGIIQMDQDAHDQIRKLIDEHKAEDGEMDEGKDETNAEVWLEKSRGSIRR